MNSTKSDTLSNGVRLRQNGLSKDIPYIQENNINKGSSKSKKEWTDKEFIARESRLTALLASSPHLLAIYHIFVAILIILFLNTIIYDFVEHGKINFGLKAICAGFGSPLRVVQLWIVEFCAALLVYPALHMLGGGGGGGGGVWAVFALQGVVLAVPSCALLVRALPVGSACIVLMEMLRFAMKIHAFSSSVWSRPKLPSFDRYLYFLFAPTLLYRDSYPRTKSIRWSVVARHLLEVAGVVFYMSFLWERFLLPHWADFGVDNKPVLASLVVRGVFACVLPGMLSFLCGFYCLLHAWLNAAAEALRFADRQFYEEWWTTSEFGSYYRAWNGVVHDWLRAHIYARLAPRAGRGAAAAAVFALSALAHELVIALAFGFFYPVLLVMFGGFGFVLVPLTSELGRRYPNLFNLMLWLSFFIGNGLLWSLYPMEYFARANCPPSPQDAWFVPRSWSCPPVRLREDWTFDNPLALGL